MAVPYTVSVKSHIVNVLGVNPLDLPGAACNVVLGPDLLKKIAGKLLSLA